MESLGYKELDYIVDNSPLAAYSVKIVKELMKTDPAHNFDHLLRVAKLALSFADRETANKEVIFIASMMHDLKNYPKDSPNRHLASTHSAELAAHLLSVRYELADDHFKNLYSNIVYIIGHVKHAIEAHSWSAGIEPETLEAKAVQDADRIESLGMIGLARLFSVGGQLNREIFDSKDPLGLFRKLDESKYCLDHFFTKIIKIHSSMQTTKGKAMARDKTLDMIEFISILTGEITGDRREDIRDGLLSYLY